MTKSSIQYLPPIAIDGHQSSGQGGPDHPMRVVTRRAAGLEAGGWTDELRGKVTGVFDDLAAEWHTRTTPQRVAVVTDALVRGLDASPSTPLGARGSSGLAVEIGSGIGIYSQMIADRFPRVVAVDLSMAMLRLAPGGPAHRVQADASALPLGDASAAAMVLINAFLFPKEVDRVLAPGGTIVWVNSSGEQTPIYLSAEDFLKALPGEWTGTASRAGQGHWCVLRRASGPAQAAPHV